MYRNRYYGGYRKKSYGYRRKYYRKRNTDLGDMLAEIIVGLVVICAKLIYKFGVLIFHIFQSFRGKQQQEFQLSAPTESRPVPLPTYQTTTVVAPRQSVVEETEEGDEGRYNLNKSLVTPTEQEFLKVLEQAVGESYRIVPQVPLSGIVKPKDSSYHYTNYHDFNRISAKKIDFVLYDKINWTPRLAIELDDRSHLKWKRIQRDMFVNDVMKGVGLPILHVPVSYEYEIEGLKEQISEKIST